MAAEGYAGQLIGVVTLLGAAVVAVPLFKRIGLGSVLGYLAAGLAIGPFGLALVSDPQSILHLAELGVVMFLFIIGLEMKPSHLWSLRKQIFGLGSLQVVVCGILLTLVGVVGYNAPWPVAFVAAMGFVLTSTAIVMQVLAERGDVNAPRGQRMVSILLLEDMLIVPLLALGALVGAGLWLLNPLFRILAKAGAREVMTAAALLVVLGAALLMELGGLSMAMGAFVAGVLLSESSFRHQLEADIEPFRGLLLGLFFLAVGMSLNLSVVRDNWINIATGVVALMAVKALCIYAVARFAGSSKADATDRAVLMAQGGEFAFVLYSAALAQNVISENISAVMTAIVVLSMVLTPLVVVLHKRFASAEAPSLDGVETPHDLHGNVLIIGFGRVGQIASQAPLARGARLSVIDLDTEVIQTAARYLNFKVYYGDGARPEVLHAAGAHHADVIIVCVDKPEAATRIAENVRSQCPNARLVVRAFDREHALALVKMDVDTVVRETFDAALRMGHEAVRAMGASDIEAQEITEDVRRRDAERFALEIAGKPFAGRALVLGNIDHIEPPPPKDKPAEPPPNPA